MSPLESLPPELLFNILSYTSPFDASLAPLSPLYILAATSKSLLVVVEEYCRSLLKKYADITPPAKATKGFVCRKKWVKWVRETCQVCGKKSTRRAILDARLTCCAGCDRKEWAKMTMTAAITMHNLSKLDLFTPNALHPSLPPLLLGKYVCMGGHTLMLGTPSVLARKSHVHVVLGEKAKDEKYLGRRVAAHDRIIAHMGITFSVNGNKGRWVEKPAGKTSGQKSMQTRESREKYVREGLEKEWAAMGMDVKGKSREKPIEIE